MYGIILGLSSIFKLVSTPKIQILQGLYALRSNIVTIVVCYKERTLLSLDSPCYRVSDNHNDSSERPFLAQPTIGSFCSEFISLKYMVYQSEMVEAKWH